MIKRIALFVAIGTTPVLAYAQNAPAAQGGAASGALTGAVGGAIVGGPIGAVVGGVGGAVVGAIIGDNTPKFREYVVTRKRPSHVYEQPVAVGTVLPRQGVQYYEVPSEYGATQYRYTVVNNRTVLVDPATGRIVQVID